MVERNGRVGWGAQAQGSDKSADSSKVKGNGKNQA